MPAHVLEELRRESRQEVPREIMTLEEDAETLKDNMFRLRFDPEKLEKERMIKLLTSRR